MERELALSRDIRMEIRALPRAAFNFRFLGLGKVLVIPQNTGSGKLLFALLG